MSEPATADGARDRPAPPEAADDGPRLGVLLGHELLSGVFFLLIGGGALALAAGYRLGSALRMGPGFFPALVAALLIVLGAARIARVLLSRNPASPVVRPAWRPLFLVCASVAVFAALIGPAGLVASVAALVVIAWTANPEWKLVELPIMVVALELIVYVVFVLGLQLPLSLWPVS